MKDTIKIDYFGWKEAGRRVAWITHFQCSWPHTGLVHECDRSRGAAHVSSTAGPPLPCPVELFSFLSSSGSSSLFSPLPTFSL